ncbi:E3 ubiquitin-protein ligase RNF5 [Nematocida minor]|uniref:E3 ubiquitin-protein ligase RNF5 n=1 Tax=Nematocida minor TaxID=1912983 RepID=UPI00221FA4A5|nr:E3 ubiquitin-protein ligase RNF5 [Nematocida minor]KAI5189407.1 E3 ubiquitin-protein ligase RNF5 [Nematocida minor]
MQEEVVLRPLNKKVDFDCSICMCEVEIPVVTRCGHLFCWTCLCGWSEKSSICPVCKTLCSLSTVIPIYSKGANTNDGFFPKPAELGKICGNEKIRGTFGYINDLRIFHMQGAEYRSNLYGKQCLLTKIFYIILLLFFIMIFLLLE